MFASVFPLVRTRALQEPFDYVVPASLQGQVRIGSLVAVPLGSQVVLGVVLGMAATSRYAADALALRDLVDLPPLPEDLLAVATRIRDHYLTSLGAALSLVTPPAAALGLQRTAVLTEAGRAALEQGRAELDVYEDGLPLKGRLRDYPGLAGLRRDGLVSIDHRLHLMEPGRESRCLARAEGTPSRLGVRQRAALQLLAEIGTCDERTLLRETSLSQAGLERLLAAGAVKALEPASCASSPPPEELLTLTAEQLDALAAVRAALTAGGQVLLHGVTGSGKTEVYLRAAAETLAAGRSVLIMVPEISLTGQTIARVQARFPGERVAVLHSALSAGERLAAYRDAAGGRSRIAIGARSAVFAPLPDLGLVVVDEEHDTSYKQDSEPRYDARTVARWRAELSRAALVLGSATPSVESWARTGLHADLRRRVDGSLPPSLEVIDMRDVHEVLSAPLRAALLRAVEAGEKTILFLNRRGLATSVSCAHCGHTWMCPRCDVALSLFKGGRELRCRTCGLREEPAPAICPLCGSVDVGRHGVGTERLEREAAALLPGVDLLRLDSDVAGSYSRLRGVLERFAAPGPRVLVGTQMIAKGHHFPEVTLVGVVNADSSLFFPDFRAEERTFAMLLQVGGRSGRGDRPGRVLVQTLNPQARPIALAAAGEEEAFYEGELERRRQLGYPPATALVGLAASATDADKAARAAAYAATVARRVLVHDEEVLGPGPLWRARGRYEGRVMVKTSDVGKTLPALRRMLQSLAPRFAQRGARLVADVEPEWF